MTKNNMYPGVKTINPICGSCKKCGHRCDYCYSDRQTWPSLQKKYSGELELDPNVLKQSLNHRDPCTYFVCSMSDLFYESLPDVDIKQVLEWLNKYPDNTYLLQSKNAPRMEQFTSYFPPNVILGTTLETNRDYYNLSHAPSQVMRYLGIGHYNLKMFTRMVSIEPIMDFDLDIFVEWLRDIAPNYVSIGADSNKEKDKNYTLPDWPHLDINS